MVPEYNQDDVEFIFFVNLMMYTKKAAMVFHKIEKGGYDEILLYYYTVRRLKCRLTGRRILKFYQLYKRNVDQLYSNQKQPTNQTGSSVDAVFARNIDKVYIKHFTSYFNYHRLMFTIAPKEQLALFSPPSEINA